MKRLYFRISLLAILLCSAAGLSAQVTRNEAYPWSLDLFGEPYSAWNTKKVNEEYQRTLLRRNPRWETERAEFDQAVHQFLSANPSGKVAGGMITIPVVVHIVYNLPAENVSDNQVFSQMIVLNEDFSRTAADTVDTPGPFVPLAGNPGIQFCLAQRDPAGNYSTGIERRQTSVSSFGFNDAVKFYSQGGLDIWDPTRYFNIWVCNTGGVCWGEFPTGTVSNTHGAVMHYTLFGSNFTSYGTFPNLSSYWDRGEIMVHEVGHALNLRHIWGDDGTACTGSDSCGDTPNQQEPSAYCPGFPLLDSCTTTFPGVMFQNFMDYSDDDCHNILTNDQCARMNAVLSLPPYNALTSSNGCVPVTLYNNDAAVSSFSMPSALVCTNPFSPVVTLKNWGLNNLTSCTLHYQVDANAPQSFSWSGNLAWLDETSVTLNPATIAPGAHTFTTWSSLPNGSADAQTWNDQTSGSFVAFDGGAPLPFSEGFESTTFVPVGWSLYNPDSSTTWARTTQTQSSGTACAKMNNIFYGAIGQTDEMISNPVDLSSLSNPVLSFQYAYTYYILSNPAGIYTDTLSIFISTDCGQSWTTIYHKGGAELATVAPIPDVTFEFVATPSDWNQQSIPLNSFQGSDAVLLKFRNKTGWGNQLYLDDINITGITAANSPELNPSVHVYPNPSSGEFEITAGSHTIRRIQITDLLGKSVYEQNHFNLQTVQVNLSALENGIYFIGIETEAGFFTEKIVKQ